MDQASTATVTPARRWIRPGGVRLPVGDPGVPDTRSPARLLLWVGRRQVGTLLAGVFFGIVWMLAQALMPFTIGRAIEDGIVDGDNRALAFWALGLLGLGAVQAGAGIMRHRMAVFNWLKASFRLAQVVSHHAARSGPAVKGRLSTGEGVLSLIEHAVPARERPAETLATLHRALHGAVVLAGERGEADATAHALLASLAKKR